jgi:hypothetical protein
MNNGKWTLCLGEVIRGVLLATAVPGDSGRVISRYSKRVSLKCMIKLLQYS